MYETYFGLRERPFSKTPDPRFLFLSRGHREALARMQYAVEECDLVLLTGEIGCGKTTLSRALMDTLDESFKVVCLINPRLTPLEFLSSLARHLGVEDPARFKVDLLVRVL
jgi:general secretion pathway protein A